MVTPASQSWMRASQIEKQLAILLEAKPSPRFDDVDGLIEQLRQDCEATILADFGYASEKGVERHLWDSHIKINQRYRKFVEHYRREDLKKNVVERRKLEKRYADFIKTSQFFYKGYIQRLASRFTGLEELHRIANRLSLNTQSVDQRITVSPKVERLVKISCHVTLLRLGDLSRYRNKLRTKDRSWDAALGYYNLANDFMPEDGSAHNQMAVIALADGNHLDAVYHLYRALAVNDPHVLAQGNLEIEFKKIRELSDKKRPPPQTDNTSNLVWWFVLLHAKFYDGVDFQSHEELEAEVLSRLALLLKEESFGETLEKIILINFSAGFFAEQRIRGADSSASQNLIRSYYFVLALNIRTMSMLLRVLRPELESQLSGDDLPTNTDTTAQSSNPEKITVVARKVLPALRQCGVWLVSLAELIVGTEGLAPVAIHAKSMWKTYADVLTQLVRLHPVESLRPVNYLLEEDETTVGFKPLRDSDLPGECDLYVDDAGSLKPHIDPETKRNHPEEEMLARVRDILLCALILHQNPKIPLKFEPGIAAFILVEEGLAFTGSSSIQAQGPMPSVESPMQSGSDFAVPNIINKPTSPGPAASLAASHNSFDDYMHHMVNDLVEPSGSRQTASNETSYGMHTRTANDVFAPLDSLSEKHQSPPQMLASLPGVWNSAFTPQPNELQPLSPTCPNTRRPLSPMPLSTRQERLDAAEHLEKITGYRRSSQERLENMTGFRRSPQSPWGGKRASNPTSQAVNDILQQSLAEQFNPMSITSSGFSQSSSLYANNTPLYRQQFNGAGVRAQFAPDHTGNNSTFYSDGSDFDTDAMLRSSIWNGSQPQRGNYIQTPPGGQGG